MSKPVVSAAVSPSPAPTSTLLRVLFIDDDDVDVELVRIWLGKAGFRVEYGRVDGAAALERALAEPWHVAICDYHMPALTAADAIATVRARAPELPVVVLSGSVGDEPAVEVLRAGARDFIRKDRLNRLAPAIERVVRETADRRARTRAQAAQVRADQLRGLGQFSIDLARELEDLLQPLARLRAPDAASAAPLPPEVAQVVTRGAQLVDALCGFSRQDPEPFTQPVALDAVVEEAVAEVRPLLTAVPALDLRVRVAGAGVVRGDAADLVAAVVHLLRNAIDACGDSGAIAITADGDDAVATIEVADDGLGMSEAVRRRAFEPCASTRAEGGLGFGLATVYATVRRHRGDVDLDTTVGAGARVTLRLPR